MDFKKLGDINGDGIVDAEDMKLLMKAFGSKQGDPNWNPDCDLNGDGKVDMFDAGVLNAHFGNIYLKAESDRYSITVTAERKR